jgi:hypothetical protein
VEFLCGDFTDISTGRDWTDGDVLFANSTCFDDKLMGTLANLAGAWACMRCGGVMRWFGGEEVLVLSIMGHLVMRVCVRVCPPAGLKKGAIFITLTKRLPSPHFKASPRPSSSPPPRPYIFNI